jgi:hypothetical protein
VSRFYTQALAVYLDDPSKDRDGEFPKFSDEIKVMPLRSSPL